jgi:hypothetical protein
MNRLQFVKFIKRKVAAAGRRKSGADVPPAQRARPRERCAGFAGWAGGTPALRWLARVASALPLACLLATPRDLHAQHAHVNAGALGTTNHAPLSFVNADGFVANSGFAFTTVLRTNGPAIGYFDSSVTFTSVFGDGSEGPPAAYGAQLALIVKSVSGPPGGSFAFWESFEGDCEQAAESITFSLPVGATNGTNRFLLSQNNGLPGEDPYGHCHGRRLTMTRPGLYTVSVQLVDVSRNGPGGGPIHTPSPFYQFYFQADTTIARLEFTNGAVAATFATLPSNAARSYWYFLEAKAAFEDEEPWESLAGPVRGDNRLKTLVDPTVGEPQRYYRLRVTTP